MTQLEHEGGPELASYPRYTASWPTGRDVAATSMTSPTRPDPDEAEGGPDEGPRHEAIGVVPRPGRRGNSAAAALPIGASFTAVAATRRAGRDTGTTRSTAQPVGH